MWPLVKLKITTLDAKKERKENEEFQYFEKAHPPGRSDGSGGSNCRVVDRHGRTRYGKSGATSARCIPGSRPAQSGLNQQVLSLHALVSVVIPGNRESGSSTVALVKKRAWDGESSDDIPSREM